MQSRNPFPYLVMSKEAVMAKRNLSEKEYERFATNVGVQIDINKKIRQTIDACQNPWSIMQRFKDLSKTSDNQEQLEISLNTTNPMQLLLEYIHWHGQAYNRGDKETIIANNLRSVKDSCFCRFGDRNLITPKIKKQWFSNRSIEMDVACMELSNLAGFEIEPADVIDFIVAHPGGKQEYILFQNIDRIANAFHALAGYRINLYYARTILKEMDARQPITAWEDCPF
jgi:hypothetical protein